MQTFDSNDYASSFELPTFNKQLGKEIKFVQHLFILLLKAFCFKAYLVSRRFVIAAFAVLKLIILHCTLVSLSSDCFCCLQIIQTRQ